MKIGIVGKGGVGKSTIAGIVARTLAREGHSVIALDCDTNPSLGLSLGLGTEETERLSAIRQSLDSGQTEHAPTAHELIQRFGTTTADGVRLAVVSQIDSPQSG